MTSRPQNTLLLFGATSDLSLLYPIPSLEHRMRTGLWEPVQADEFLMVTVSDKIRAARNP